LRSAERLRRVIKTLGMPSELWLAGYRIKVVDGNHMANTERQLGVLRDCPAEPIPAQSLVVLEPETGLVVQWFAALKTTHKSEANSDVYDHKISISQTHHRPLT
jgi:hypothetical protein